MLRWLRRVLLRDTDQRRRFMAEIDALNEGRHGGAPIVVERCLGQLALPSRVLLLSDPQYVARPMLVESPGDAVQIRARLRQYPSRRETVAELLLDWSAGGVDSEYRIGELPIDSAQVVVADRDAIRDHWVEVGPERIGEISTLKGDRLVKELRRHFRVTTRFADQFTAEIADPVSPELEAEIRAWLASRPEYAKYPYLHFRIRTNNSFERALAGDQGWKVLPVGNAPLPLMFVCQTGRGDGTYEVIAHASQGVLRRMSIEFIAPDNAG